MDILFWVAILVVSLAVLVKGSDWFVDAAEKVGLALGIPPFIIGVTIVAMGTSLPELASSIVAVFSGQSEIVAGNAIGSNIANIALVLGITAVIGKRVKFGVNLMEADVPLLICSAFLLWFILVPDADGIARVDIFESILLLAGMVIFIAYSFSSDGEEDKDVEKTKIPLKVYGTLLLAGLLVYVGAKYTVDSIIALSDMLGIQSEAIALSVVALGTSLPEIVVSVTAMKRGKPDIAIGNILGSNIFNTFAVVGIPGLIAQIRGEGLLIPAVITDFSMPVMIAMTLLFFFLMLSKSVSRWEGMMLLIFYIFFVVKLF
jgi:cation:H+ antiporter